VLRAGAREASRLKSLSEFETAARSHIIWLRYAGCFERGCPSSSSGPRLVGVPWPGFVLACRASFLLSLKAGLRAVEIAHLKWGHPRGRQRDRARLHQGRQAVHSSR
jgi:hypothetical protein